MADVVRYDPIWRRIKLDSYALRLEGAFPAQAPRLEGLNNWGVLSWLHPHATATKLAHHYGVEHAARQFLDARPERAKYSASFRPAAHFLHIGHVPLSYAGEEAILRAAHVRPDVQSFLNELVDEVVQFGSLACDSGGHKADCAQRIRTGAAPFELYRWLAAWRVKRRWPKVWSAIKGAAADGSSLEPEDVKRALVRSLVCRDDRGYAVLGMCNLVDFVQRDLLQSGTAALTVDSGALWDENPIGPNAAREWALLYAAYEYLRSRFYEAPDALLVHGLTARAAAQGLLAAGGVTAIKTLLDGSQSDDEFIAGLPGYHRGRIDHVRGCAKRLDAEWTHIGRFHDVSVRATSRFDVEDWFSDRDGTGRLSYPFTSKVAVTVLLGSGRPSYLAGADRQYVAVDVHSTAVRPRSARYALEILAKVVEWIGPWDADKVTSALISWMLAQPCESRSSDTSQVLGLGAMRVAGTVTRELRALRAMRSLRPLNDHPYAASLADYVIENPDAEPPAVGGLVLGLPWTAYRTAPGRRLLSAVRDECVAMAGVTGKGWGRGHALEAAVICDRLLVGTPRFRFTASNVVALGEDGQPSREWDLVVVDLSDDGRWSVSATESAVSRSAQKDDKARESLEVLGAALQGGFSDVSSFSTSLATLRGGSLHYEDARRGFSATS